MCKLLMEGNEEEGARLFSVVPSDATKGSGHELKHENPSGLKKVPFYCEDD